MWSQITTVSRSSNCGSEDLSRLVPTAVKGGCAERDDTNDYFKRPLHRMTPASHSQTEGNSGLEYQCTVWHDGCWEHIMSLDDQALVA